MALDVDADWLGLELEHTKSWCRLGKLQRSLVGKTQVVAWVELKILVENKDHPMEEKREEPRQPLCP